MLLSHDPMTAVEPLLMTASELSVISDAIVTDRSCRFSVAENTFSVPSFDVEYTRSLASSNHTATTELHKNAK